MKTKVLALLLTSSVLALAAWYVHVLNPAQADEIPEKYRETVSKGLEYLAKNQLKDGRWEGDGGRHPVAMTGLVGVALLMERDNPSGSDLRPAVREVKYLAIIRKAVDWLIDQSKPGRDGLIFSDHPTETSRYMEGHGLATLFLAGVCREEYDEVRRKKLTDVLLRAVKYIVKAQSTQGGWYHTSKVEGHDFDIISATVIQIQALQAAENAGIPVPSATINDAKEYLRKSVDRYDKDAKPGQDRARQVDTASVLACLFNDEYRFGDDLPAKGTLGESWYRYCQSAIPVGRDSNFGRDDLTHFYYAQVMFNEGGDAWNKYRTATFDHLQNSQNKDGSWPASDGMGVGPVYATALWSTVLQLDKNTHPSRRRLPVHVK